MLVTFYRNNKTITNKTREKQEGVTMSGPFVLAVRLESK